jgi:hypothetical protein
VRQWNDVQFSVPDRQNTFFWTKLKEAFKSDPNLIDANDTIKGTCYPHFPGLL